jgi:hypothetical protein
MRRRLLIVLFALGTVVGFSLGFLSVRRHCHGGGYYGHRAKFEQRVSDTCAEAALRVYRAQPPPAAPAR